MKVSTIGLRALGLLLFFVFIALSPSGNAQNFRPIDGRGANPNHPEWGATNTPVISLVSPAFSDAIGAPSGQNRPLARDVSNRVFSQDGDVLDAGGRTDFVFVWGQFVDHDITFSPDNTEEAYPIPMPANDPYFKGVSSLPFFRSKHLDGTGTNINNPRKYYNGITPYLDGSNVYGSDPVRSKWLRTLVDGKLKTSKGNLLPFNTVTGEYDAEIDPNAPEMAMPFPFVKKYFVAGDVRANENILLTSFHTLFMREHNRWCDILKAEHPSWDDNQLFLKARAIVSGEIQSITYNQWLSAMGIELAPYAGFNAEVNPQIANVFAAAAYRYGHSTINSTIKLLREDGSVASNGILFLRNAFFNPSILKERGIAPMFRGMVTQVQQANDCKMINDLRNFLFGPPGAGGMDLASANITRGRDRGLPDFNTIRVSLGMDAYTSFEEITDDVELVDALKEVYGDVNKIDPWVGFLAEQKEEGAMFGEALKVVLAKQFSAIRDGDPFFYLVDKSLTEEERSQIINVTLSDIIERNTDADFMPENVFFVIPAYAEYRSIDGSGNNLEHPEWGARGSMQQRLTPVAYADGINTPAAPDRENPRTISNLIFDQRGDVLDPLNLSDYNFAWGQFIDHDITFVPDSDNEPAMIQVKECDQWFDPNCEGRAVIPVMRSKAMPGTGTDINNPRQVFNGITAFIDGSTIYGSTKEWANWLRTFKEGKLKTSQGNMLPFNTYSGEYDSPVDPSAPKLAMPFPNVTKYFVSGDIRCNENPLLTSMHTLFMREHNSKCEELKVEHPDWSDEQLYQQARKWVGALIQALAFEEWLPTIGVKLPPYKGYNPDVQPQIFNVFSAAAYRYGHSTINSKLVRMDNDGEVMPQGNILLRDAFFNPNALRDMNGIYPYLKGMCAQVEQDFDTKMIDDLRNFLFGKPGDGGMDLAAINIQRGRERGLPDYNTIRASFGLPKVKSFTEITSNPELRQKLVEAYGSVDNIDPWVGMLAEDHPKDALFGELVMKIITLQFQALRDGDRFYYENDPGLSKEEIQELKNTTFSDVIMRHTELTDMPSNVFIVDPQLVANQDINEAEPAQNLVISPNPTRDVVRVSADHNVDAVRVYDEMGKMHLGAKVSPSDGVLTLNVQTLKKGVYLLQEYAGNQMVAQGKLVKI